MVSVIVTALCNDRYLRTTLKSVFDQTFEPKEIILVISNMHENRFFLELIPKHPKLTVMPFDELLNASQARNKGIEKSTGKYLAFLDGDDVWEHTKLEEQIRVMSTERVNFCVTHFSIINDFGQTIGKGVISDQIFKSHFIVIDNQLCFSSAILSRELLSNERFNENLLKRNDLDLWLRLVGKKNFQPKVINKNLTSYRFYSGSLSSKKLKIIKDQWLFYHRILNKGQVKALFLMCLFISRKTLKYYIDGRLRKIFLNNISKLQQLLLIPSIHRYLTRAFRRPVLTKEYVRNIPKNRVSINFEPDDIHFGDVLFWLPTLIFLKKNRILELIKLGKKNVIFSKEFLDSFSKHEPSSSAKPTISIGYGNTISSQTHDVYFNPLQLEADRSISRSIFQLFSPNEDEYLDCVDAVRKSHFFQWNYNQELKAITSGRTVVCLDAQTRAELGDKKRNRILRSLKHNKHQEYVAIGLDISFPLPPNVVDLRRQFSMNELLGLVHYNTNGFIGLDNFWAHYFSLFELKPKVKFRGTYFYKHGLFHLKYMLHAFR